MFSRDTLIGQVACPNSHELDLGFGDPGFILPYVYTGIVIISFTLFCLALNRLCSGFPNTSIVPVRSTSTSDSLQVTCLDSQTTKTILPSESNLLDPASTARHYFPTSPSDDCSEGFETMDEEDLDSSRAEAVAILARLIESETSAFNYTDVVGLLDESLSSASSSDYQFPVPTPRVGPVDYQFRPYTIGDDDL